MSWLEKLMAIEELDEAPLDAELVAQLERAGAGVVSRPVRFATPTFKDYASTELRGC